MLRVIVAALVVSGAVGFAQSPPAGPRFEISFARNARSEPLTGRVYVAFARDADRSQARPGATSPTPIDLSGPTGVPLFSAAVEGLSAGAPTIITADNFGHPVQSLRDIPAGEYWVQPFFNVYTKFDRKDGHTVWM